MDHCSPSQCRVRQQPYAKTTLHKIRNIYTMHKNSPHAYKLIPLDVVIILKTLQCSYFVYIFVIFVLCISSVTIFVCRVTLYCNLTMAEANGIRDLPKQDVQSILEGFSINDSERSLPQVPNETLGLSSVSQTLSSSFNRLRRGITNHIGKHTSQPQDQTSKEINVEQLSPTSLRMHLTAYQATVRTLHVQNDHNAELLGRLEAAVTEKDTEISRLRNEEMEKELRLQHSIVISRHNYLQSKRLVNKLPTRLK